MTEKELREIKNIESVVLKTKEQEKKEIKRKIFVKNQCTRLFNGF